MKTHDEIIERLYFLSKKREDGEIICLRRTAERLIKEALATQQENFMKMIDEHKEIACYKNMDCKTISEFCEELKAKLKSMGAENRPKNEKISRAKRGLNELKRFRP